MAQNHRGVLTVPWRENRAIKRSLDCLARTWSRSESKGLTREQLGWATGLHQTAITRIESDERQPHLATVFMLARGLEVPSGAMFEGSTRLGSDALADGNEML
jgi:transcriptional regulator with XRE-family HTH domain